jgi:hypothetical protein
LFSPRESSEACDSFNGTDVILKLQGMHFTLLQPLDEHSPMSPIDQILDLFPEIVETRPLHLQLGDAGDIVREAGRVPSLMDLHQEHCPSKAACPTQHHSPFMD